MAASSNTGAFARLPSELKLRILEYHTLWLRTEEYARGGCNPSIIEALSAFTHCQPTPPSCFHPTAVDLVRTHFAEEAKLFPLELFRDFYVRTLRHRQGHDPNSRTSGDADHEWSDFLEQYPNASFTARDSDTTWWLRFLALTASRVQTIVDMLEDTSYAAMASSDYYDYLRLWRFLAPPSGLKPRKGVMGFPRFVRNLRSEYFFNLPRSERDHVVNAVRNMAGIYARRAMQGCREPFAKVGQHYQDLILRLDVTWRQFIQSGALAACLQHHVLAMRPEELFDFLVTSDSGEYAPYDEPWMYLTVHVEGNIITLASSSSIWLGSGSSQFEVENTLWMLETRSKERNVSEDGQQLGPGRGRLAFNKREVRDLVWCDGISSLGDFEFVDLFQSAY